MCLAVPGKIVSISGEGPLMLMGKVNFGGIFKEVNLAYVPEAKVDDYVVVHVGFALNTIDEAEAKQVLEYFKEMGELEESSGQVRKVRRFRRFEEPPEPYEPYEPSELSPIGAPVKYLDEYRDAAAARQ